MDVPDENVTEHSQRSYLERDCPRLCLDRSDEKGGYHSWRAAYIDTGLVASSRHSQQISQSGRRTGDALYRRNVKRYSPITPRTQRVISFFTRRIVFFLKQTLPRLNGYGAS